MSESESVREGPRAAAERAAGETRARSGTTFGVPRWAGDAGRWSWIIIGVHILLVVLISAAS